MALPSFPPAKTKWGAVVKHLLGLPSKPTGESIGNKATLHGLIRRYIGTKPSHPCASPPGWSQWWPREGTYISLLVCSSKESLSSRCQEGHSKKLKLHPYMAMRLSPPFTIRTASEKCAKTKDLNKTQSSPNIIPKMYRFQMKISLLPRTRKISSWMRKKTNICQHQKDTDIRITWQGF